MDLKEIKGIVIVVMGEQGSGKSTLIRIFSGLLAVVGVETETITYAEFTNLQESDEERIKAKVWFVEAAL